MACIRLGRQVRRCSCHTHESARCFIDSTTVVFPAIPHCRHKTPKSYRRRSRVHIWTPNWILNLGAVIHWGHHYIFLICILRGGVQFGPLGTAVTNRPIVPATVIMMMEKLVEWWLAWKTEVFGENLSQCRFVHHKPHMQPGREPGPSRWEASD
jgi:hypothetical protein